MQRYHGGNCTSAVNNNTNSVIGAAGVGISSGDSVRGDLIPANFSINSRRNATPVPPPYRLRCEKESLNSRLGPPDFHPQTLDCPEETLTKEYVQYGYRETVEGLEEAKEISVTQVNTFTRPVVLKCKEAIRKRLRAINQSRAQKRKAGQVYGEPLSGGLLSRPSVFPEQKSCGEDFKKRWIEGLSQCHKSLRSLADHVPHGYRKKALFEVLIKNNVPLLRATWFIKVAYLNQVRPGSSGAADRTQLSRSELWTKDITDYLQCILDEKFPKNDSKNIPQIRNRPAQMLYGVSGHPKTNPASFAIEAEELSLNFKWWYVVRLLNCHLAEGLILPSQVIDWVFLQFQDKDLLQILQLLLPIIYEVLEAIASCQTYVRKFVDIALRLLKEPSSEGSELVGNSQRAYTVSALVEMIQFLILSVPDTFVALDGFPFPQCVTRLSDNRGSQFPKASTVVDRFGNSLTGACVSRDKILGTRYPSSCFDRIVSSIQKRAVFLAKAASPVSSGHNVAKAVQALDKALVLGDLQEGYKFLFEGSSDFSVGEGWIGEVSSGLRLSLKWIASVGLPLVYSVFLLCEWCTCDFRDFRTKPSKDVKFTGRKDFSQVYVAVRLLKLKMRALRRAEKRRKSSENKFSLKSAEDGSVETSNLFESPGPLHDIIVCWVDQHEAFKGEAFKRVQLLLTELTRSGIFSPQGYVRQLLVSGILDNNGPVDDPDKQRRHYRILKQLSSSCICEFVEDEPLADRSLLLEAINIYASERRLLLRGLQNNEHNKPGSTVISSNKQQRESQTLQIVEQSSSHHAYQLKMSQSSNLSQKKDTKSDRVLDEMKHIIAEMLLLPKSSDEAIVDESQVSLKRTARLVSGKIDTAKGTPGCEECQSAKRQKVGEEKYSFLRGSLNRSEDEDTWWSRKEVKVSSSLKVDQPLKQTKQAPRGRQKSVRKTQSLAQLAAARIEGSQGASTSHACDNKIVCPHHRPGTEGEVSKYAENNKTTMGSDIVSIGKTLKGLKFADKRSIAVWLISSVKNVVEESDKSNEISGPVSRPLPTAADEKCSTKWKLGEDELSIILYVMDICADIPSAIKFLILLLPKAVGNLSTPIHSGRSMMLPRNVESHGCEVREAFLLSAIRRYENVLVAVDLIPEVLSAAMQRLAVVLASSGKLSGSPTFLYARYLLKKYGSVSSVIEWEKNSKATCDKRLFSELEAGKLQNGDFGLSFVVPAGVEDPDDFIRQKISGNRLSRTGMNMRDLVQRSVDNAVRHLFGKERELFGAGAQKNAGIDKWDEGHQIAQQIIVGIMDCMRQTGGAAQEGDPSLVSFAVSAIVGNVGPAIAKMPDFTAASDHSNVPAPTGSLSFARRVLRIHIYCLCLLKEALGERHSRVFEIALATEASSALTAVFLPGKGARGQFQLSPDMSNVNLLNDVPSNLTKVSLGRATKTAAAVSSLIVGAVIHGATSLERIITVFRLKEGLDLMQYLRNTRSHANGNARSALRVESSLDVNIHWFRLLVGNCRTVCDGVIVDLLGEPSVVALSRMQRTLPISLVLPPAYSLFAFMIWRPFIFNITLANREEISQLLQSLTLALSDALKHAPFRDICLRDTLCFFDLVSTDATDSEFASVLELSGSDKHLKAKAFTPLRARLFLNALVDCKSPHSVLDDGTRLSGATNSKPQFAESDTNLSDSLIRALDNLQPAKFHWQWLELRLFLSEQTLLEKLESNDAHSIADAMRSLLPNPNKVGSSDNDNFIPAVLTRLSVRPNNASLLSEVVHLLGRSLEDTMLLHVKRILEGQDVLFGKKSVRQRLVNLADSKGFSRAQFSKPWGWGSSTFDPVSVEGDKRGHEIQSVEEGEVIEDDCKKHDVNTDRQFITERALVELALPCIDRSSDESRSKFASDLIKQMNGIEQQISGVTFGFSKQMGAASSGTESSIKTNMRKNMKGGGLGLSRRAAVAPVDSIPPSPVALRASLSLRLQLLMRLLPSICTDSDQSGRSLRFMLVSVVLRLLGSRVVYEETELSLDPGRGSPQKEAQPQTETCADVSSHLSGTNVFDWLLLVLHALLSTSLPSWLRPRTSSKPTGMSTKFFPGFSREMLESLQGELNRMQLPEAIRWRIQAAMPILVPNVQSSVSCQPPSVSPSAIASLQPTQPSPLPKNIMPSVRSATTGTMLAKSKSTTAAMQPDHDSEVDPWLLLEDGAGSGSSSSNTALIGGGDNANLKAASWLKGAVRVRRTDLTYIGAVDDDS